MPHCVLILPPRQGSGLEKAAGGSTAGIRPQLQAAGFAGAGVSWWEAGGWTKKTGGGLDSGGPLEAAAGITA